MPPENIPCDPPAACFINLKTIQMVIKCLIFMFEVHYSAYKSIGIDHFGYYFKKLEIGQNYPLKLTQ